jgi:hypothetical protein
MDAEKKKVVVQEIEQWRRSKLLPEHYCDFLLNLYQEGEAERQASWMGLNTGKIKESNWKIWFLTTAIVVLISFYSLHFNTFPFPMQIASSAVLVLACFVMGARQRVKNPLLSYIFVGIGSSLMLTVGILILTGNGASSTAVILYTAVCSVIWMVTGILAEMPIFHFCGWVVLMLIYAIILNQNIESFDWLGLQIGWIPLSVMLAWLGWLFTHKNKKIGSVLLLAGCLAWFAPEIYGLALTNLNASLMQASITGKIIAAGAILFGLRKKWIEWVA